MAESTPVVEEGGGTSGIKVAPTLLPLEERRRVGDLLLDLEV